VTTVPFASFDFGRGAASAAPAWAAPKPANEAKYAPARLKKDRLPSCDCAITLKGGVVVE